jgi:dTDP-glucose 4,6-dehydratase
LIDFEEPFTEESPLKPNSPYAASKTSADLLCRSFYKTYQYPITITRCSNNYGTNQHREKLVPKLIHNIREGKKIPIYGDGKNIRDWVHVQDHCEAIDVVLHKGENGEIYNIGGECEKRNIEIVDHLLLNFEQSYDLVEYVEDRKGHDWRYAMDISKIKQQLGWYPKVTFEEGMAKLINRQEIY